MGERDSLALRTLELQAEKNSLDLQEVKEVVSKLLIKVDNHSSIPEWLTLEQACALKGGASFNTVRCAAYLRPGAGNPKFQRYCGGRLVFHRDTVVIPWLSVTDDNLEEYLKNVCEIKVIPEKILKIIKKAKEKNEIVTMKEVV